MTTPDHGAGAAGGVEAEETEVVAMAISNAMADPWGGNDWHGLTEKYREQYRGFARAVLSDLARFRRRSQATDAGGDGLADDDVWRAVYAFNDVFPLAGDAAQHFAAMKAALRAHAGVPEGKE